MRYLLALVLAAAGLTLVACGDNDDPDAPPATGGERAATESSGGARSDGRPNAAKPADEDGADGRPGTELVIADSQFGPMLFNGERQAIYLFDREESDAAECYGDCAAAWPPVLTEGDPRAADGVDPKLLGTTERDDGSTQVTYNGHPLYYYAHEGPGQVLCHNVAEFGGLWLVVQASGDAAPA